MKWIQQHCAQADPVWVDGLLGISAGIVERKRQESADELVRRADQAMYRQKQTRNLALVGF
jgi:PleD family two-component response regulator